MGGIELSGMAEGGVGGETVGTTLFFFTCQGSNSIRSVRQKAKKRWKVASAMLMNEEGGCEARLENYRLRLLTAASIVRPVSGSITWRLESVEVLPPPSLITPGVITASPLRSPPACATSSSWPPEHVLTCLRAFAHTRRRQEEADFTFSGFKAVRISVNS